MQMPSMRPSEGVDPGPFGPAFEVLKSFIVNTTGHARLAAKDEQLLEKIQRRIAANKLASLRDYLDFVQRNAAGKAEFDGLIAELTIGETSFFRHQEQFDALRDHVLPACLKRNSGTRQLRIWSAGCANGAEAYSIAILVHALLGERLSEWNVTIVGSDINRAFLAEAERGLYSAWTLRDVPEEQRSAFFVRHDGGWAIRDKYLSNVTFVYHNLASDEFPCFYKNIFSFDVVMCRNVMIYFDVPNNLRLVANLKSVLADDGWLFVGPTDFAPQLSEKFALEKIGNALIFRNRASSAPRVDAPMQRAAKAVVTQERDARIATARSKSGSAHEVSTARAAAATPLGGRRNRLPTDDIDRSARKLPLPEQPSIAAIIELADKGDWATAARFCEAFLNADSCNASAHYYYALVQHCCGQSAAAERSLKQAIYLDSNFALAHYQLGLVHKEAHNTAQCLRSFRNVLATLSRLPDGESVSPCGQVTALDLRELATQQLQLLGQL